MEKQPQRRKVVTLDTMVYGKVPPQAKDLEEIVLGSILVEPRAFDEVAEMLVPECFYVEANQRIFKAMQSLSAKGQPIDNLMVVEHLRSTEELEIVGGAYAVTRLTNNALGAANIKAHCRVVLQKFLAREVIRVSSQLLHEAYEDSTDPFDLLDTASELINQISVNHVHGDMVHIDHALIQATRKIVEWNAERERNPDGHLTGVTSGFHEIDRLTRGWQPGDLVIVAARPSVGKSALALALARAAAATKVTVGFWSLEMGLVSLILRLLASESGLQLHSIQTGRLGEPGMKELHRSGIQKLAGIPIFFDETTGLTIPKLRAKARRLKKKENLGLIIIDYLQLMTSAGENKTYNREQEISSVSRGLKMLAKELGIPIIALSQLSREVEKRSDPRPQLSDLRESGAIEQDADMVCFLWAPPEIAINEDAGLLFRRYFRIAKQRNGMLGTVEFDFKTDIQRFERAAIDSGFRPVQLADFTEPSKKNETI